MSSCIYKISCKDEFVTECYIGQTVNFKKRTYTHKSVCNNKGKGYLYWFIRNNGGWNNWKMEIIKEVEKDKLKEVEKEFILKLQPELNTTHTNTNDKYNSISYRLYQDEKYRWY